MFVCPLLLQAGGNASHILYFKDKPTELICSANTDSRDIPVNAAYIAVLRQQGIDVISVSKWLNAALVKALPQAIAQAGNMPFVESVQHIPVRQQSAIVNIQSLQTCTEILDFEDNYVSSFAQFHLLNGEYLHEMGYRGEEMKIAVCDNGFYNANNNTAFAEVFSDNRVKDTYDFVNSETAVYNEISGAHGSNCLSLIAGKKENEFIGTATKADYYLYHTENNTSETLQEEFNLALALERCHEQGVQVVSVSLGYFEFENAAENFDTTEMKKNNTPGAKAVNIAASKGILVCVAAGNEGASSWKYITSPGNADSAFTIAAVNSSGTPANFTGYALSSDTRIKPNVAAMGVGTAILNTNGTVSNGNGTSYACPSIAGLSACLWQAFPDKTNWEIKTAIEQSASQYLNPDKRIGYGIPDFKKAYQLLANPTFVSAPSLENEIRFYPVPVQHTLYMQSDDNIRVESLQLFNAVGQTVMEVRRPSQQDWDVSHLSKGMYLVQVTTDKGILLKKLIKD